jgi:hypothetical protein
MSFLTGTNAELIYTSTAVGATLATFTTEANMNTVATMGQVAQLPPNFWLSTGNQVGRGIRIVARGILSSTGSPTFTFTIRGLGTTTTPNISTAPILLGSAAVTAGATVTNQFWELQGDVIVTALGTGTATATIQGLGYVMGPAFASPFIQPVYGGAASPGTTANLTPTVTNFINVNAACGTSSASNSITLQQLLVFGLN